MFHQQQIYFPQKNSKTLSKEETELINKLIGTKQVLLAKGVVQLFLTSKQNSAKWIHRASGVLCFIRDLMNESYYFRLYCLNQQELIWEHELYHNLQYICEKTFFHMFEGQRSAIGFNFANNYEADVFKEVVLSKFELKNTKTLKLKKTKTVKKSKQNSSKITSVDIGLPTDFVHVAHFGLDKMFGDIENKSEIAEICKLAGLTKEQLENKKTRDFAVKFINTQNDIRRSTRKAPPPPSLTHHKKTKKAPLPPKRTLTIPESQDVNTAVPSPPAPPPQLPPPPPLPPTMTDFSNHTLENNNEMSVMPIENTPTDRGNLLKSIQEGVKLKPLNDQIKAPTGRDNLLKSIQEGVKLKAVDLEEITKKEPHDRNEIAAALKNVLMQRKFRMRENSDSEDEEQFAESDWV